MSLVGIPVLPREARNWQFYQVAFTISDGTRVVKKGTYWTCYGSMIDRDMADWIDTYGRQGVEYTWEWEIKKERKGIPSTMIYNRMSMGSHWI